MCDCRIMDERPAEMPRFIPLNMQAKDKKPCIKPNPISNHQDVFGFGIKKTKGMATSVKRNALKRNCGIS